MVGLNFDSDFQARPKHLENIFPGINAQLALMDTRNGFWVESGDFVCKRCGSQALINTKLEDVWGCGVCRGAATLPGSSETPLKERVAWGFVRREQSIA